MSKLPHVLLADHLRSLIAQARGQLDQAGGVSDDLWERMMEVARAMTEMTPR